MIKCPKCKKELKSIHYVKEEGYEIWNYPIKKKELDFDGGDLIDSEFHNCFYECPECKEELFLSDLEEIGLDL